MTEPEKKRRREDRPGRPRQGQDPFEALGPQIEQLILEHTDVKDAMAYLTTQTRFRKRIDDYLGKKRTLVLDAQGDSDDWSPVVRQMMRSMGNGNVGVDQISYLFGIRKSIYAVRLTKLMRAHPTAFASVLKVIAGYPRLSSIVLEDSHCESLFTEDNKDFWDRIRWKTVTVFAVTDSRQPDEPAPRMPMAYSWIPFHPESKQVFDKLQELRLALEPWHRYRFVGGLPEPYWPIDALLTRIPNLDALRVLDLEGHWSWSIQTLETLQTRCKLLKLIRLCHRRPRPIEDDRALLAQRTTFSAAELQGAVTTLIEQCPALATLQLAWDDEPIRIGENDFPHLSFDVTWHLSTGIWHGIGSGHPVVRHTLAFCKAQQVILEDFPVIGRPTMKTLLAGIQLPAQTTHFQVVGREIFNPTLVHLVFSTFLKQQGRHLVDVHFRAQSINDTRVVYEWSVEFPDAKKKQDVNIRIKPRFHKETDKALETAERILDAARTHGYTPRHLSLPIPNIDDEEEDEMKQWATDSKRLATLIRRSGVTELELKSAESDLEAYLGFDETWVDLLSSSLHEFKAMEFMAEFLADDAHVVQSLGSPSCTLKRLELQLRDQEERSLFVLLKTVHSLERLTLACQASYDMEDATKTAGQVFQDLCRRNPRLASLRLDFRLPWQSGEVASSLPVMSHLTNLQLLVQGRGILYQDLVTIRNQCAPGDDTKITLNFLEARGKDLPLSSTWKRVHKRDLAVQWPLAGVRILDEDDASRDVTRSDTVPVFYESMTIPEDLKLTKTATTSAGPLDKLLEDPAIVEQQLVEKAINEALLTPDQLQLRRAIESKTSFVGQSMLRRYVYNRATKTHEFYFDSRLLDSLDFKRDVRLRRSVQSLIDDQEEKERLALFF